MAVEKSCQTNFSRKDILRLDGTNEIKVPVEEFGLDTSCQTNFSLTKLKDAVRSSNIELVREILLENSNRWNRLDHLYYLGSIISLATVYCENEKIYGLLVDFIEFGTEDKLVNMFVIPILKGNVDFLKLYTFSQGYMCRMLAGSIGKSYYIGTLPGLLFCRRNLSTRKDMFKLLVDCEARFFLSKYPNFINDTIAKFVRKDDTDAAEIAEILLDLKTPVDLSDNAGSTPLCHAVSSENIQLVSLLISRGADVNHSDLQGMSPLHTSCRVNNVDMVTLLLENKAEVNAQNVKGHTPLHHACFHGHDQVIELLIQRGADISVETKTGLIPLSCIISSGDIYEKCMKVIVKEFSKLTFGNKTTSAAKVFNVILENRATSDYFYKCTSELELMSTTKFHASYSYYSVLKKSIITKKLAYLTKNQRLVAKFQADVRNFPCYEKDLLKNFDVAVDLRVEMDNVESRVNSIFYGYFPSLVIRKLTNHLVVENIPLP